MNVYRNVYKGMVSLFDSIIFMHMHFNKELDNAEDLSTSKFDSVIVLFAQYKLA